ncbi:MAG: hypothetical protein WAT71_12905 [Ignavibacteria bacterium]
MKYLFIIFLGLFLFQSCGNEDIEQKILSEEEKRKQQEEMEFSRKVIGAELKKGMYNYNSNTNHFTECSTNRKYILVGESETNEMKKAYQDKRFVSPTLLAYVEIEAFQSFQDIGGDNIPDTVLVVTKFLKFDAEKNCN